MENSIYTGLSQQMALRAKMDIIANNVANVSTPGYRTQNLIFKEYITPLKRSDETRDPLSMVLDYGQYQSTEPGSMRGTGNPLDVALNGPGWFGVQTSEGVMYTRAGNFQMNAKGELVTGSGNLVAGDGGGSIVIPQEAREIKIAQDGTVATDKGAIGKLMIVEFDNDQILEASGNGLYKAAAASRPAENTQAAQGMLEGSNVQPVIEMTRMIDVLRNYQATQKMLQNEHDRQRAMIQRLTDSRA